MFSGAYLTALTCSGGFSPDPLQFHYSRPPPQLCIPVICQKYNGLVLSLLSNYDDLLHIPQNYH